MNLGRTNNRRGGTIEIPRAAVLILVGVAVFVGVLAGRNSLLVVSIPIAIVAWIGLARYYEFPLAVLLVGFYVYPAVFGLLDIPTSSLATTFFYAFVATAALAGAVARHPEYLRTIFRQRGTLVGVALVGWTLTSFVMFSSNNDLAQKRIGTMVFLMIIPLIVGQFVTERELRRLYWFCVGLTLVGAMLAFNYLLHTDVSAEVRISADPNASALGFAYSSGLAMLMGLGLLMNLRASAGKQILLGAQFAGVAMVFFASGSRGPFLALAAGIVVFLSGTPRRMWVWILMAVGMIGVIGYFTLPYIPDIVYARLAMITSSASSGGLGAEFGDSRGHLWLLSLATWQENPIFGVGLGNFTLYSQGMASFSHNFILESLSELGLVGFVILCFFLWIVGNLAIQLLRQRGTHPLSLSLVALFAYSIVSMSFSGQLQTAVDFWLISGLVIGLGTRWLQRNHVPREIDQTGQAISASGQI